MHKIHTLTFNDINISYGPNIHFIELWNTFTTISQNEFKVTGLCGNWRNTPSDKNLNCSIVRRISIKKTMDFSVIDWLINREAI